MKRLFVVYNPNSSRYADVKKDVLSKLKNLSGYLIGKYELEKTDVDANAAKFAKILKDDDLVISVGGDATGVVAVNAILKSRKDVYLAVLPYGNFNDLSRTLGTKKIEDIFDAGSAKNNIIKYYPLEIYVDDKFFRYASSYVTIGMTAEAVGLYDRPKMRKLLKSAPGRNIGSYTNLAGWYFKNRHKKQFLPNFKLNGKLQPQKTSDYLAINGSFIARVMKGRRSYESAKTFRSQTEQLTSCWRLFNFMMKSMFSEVPGENTSGDTLIFTEPSDIKIQAEGEFKAFADAKKVEIRKSSQYLRVIAK